MSGSLMTAPLVAGTGTETGTGVGVAGEVSKEILVKQNQIMSEIIQLIADAKDLQSTNRKILALVRTFYSVDRVRLCPVEIVTEGGKVESPRLRTFLDGPSWPGTTPQTVQEIAIDTAKSGKLNLTKEMRWQRCWDVGGGNTREVPLVSVLTVALKDRTSKVLAVLQAAVLASSGGFSNDQVYLFQILADGAGIALRKAHDDHMVAKQTRKLNALLHILQIQETFMNNNHKASADYLICQMVESAGEALNADKHALLLFDKVNEKLSCIISSENSEAAREALCGGFAVQVCRTGKSLNVKHAPSHQYYNRMFDSLTGYSTFSALVHPLTDKVGNVSAVLLLLNKREAVTLEEEGSSVDDGKTVPLTFTEFDNADEELMTTICTYLGNCLRRHYTDMLVVNAMSGNTDMEGLLSLYGSDGFDLMTELNHFDDEEDQTDKVSSLAESSSGYTSSRRTTATSRRSSFSAYHPTSSPPTGTDKDRDGSTERFSYRPVVSTEDGPVVMPLPDFRDGMKRQFSVSGFEDAAPAVVVSPLSEGSSSSKKSTTSMSPPLSSSSSSALSPSGSSGSSASPLSGSSDTSSSFASASPLSTPLDTPMNSAISSAQGTPNLSAYRSRASSILPADGAGKRDGPPTTAFNRQSSIFSHELLQNHLAQHLQNVKTGEGEFGGPTSPQLRRKLTMRGNIMQAGKEAFAAAASEAARRLLDQSGAWTEAEVGLGTRAGPGEGRNMSEKLIQKRHSMSAVALSSNIQPRLELLTSRPTPVATAPPPPPVNVNSAASTVSTSGTTVASPAAGSGSAAEPKVHIRSWLLKTSRRDNVDWRASQFARSSFIRDSVALASEKNDEEGQEIVVHTTIADASKPGNYDVYIYQVEERTAEFAASLYQRLERVVTSASRIALFRSLDYNVLDYSSTKLLEDCFLMFIDSQCLDYFKIDKKKFSSFLVDVMYAYCKNPYHNWHHGVNVFWWSYHCLTTTSLPERLTKVDVFGLLISCLCHDVNHPGNTNMYEVMTYSPLALLHNDHSVLENHHIVTTFTLIRKPENNFLQDFPVDQMRHIRKVIITNILGTDMSQHVELCKKMDKLKPKLESISLMVESDRMLLMEIMIHSGDLVAPILPLRSSLPWEARITKEFITQNILEKEKGLPLTAVMTDLTTPVIRGKKQVDFVDFIIIPLWRSVSEQFPEFKRCMSTIQLYRSHFLPLANANMKSAIVTNAAAFKTRTSNMEERLHEIEVMQRRLSVMAWQEERDEVGNSDGKEEGK